MYVLIPIMDTNFIISFFIKLVIVNAIKYNYLVKMKDELNSSEWSINMLSKNTLFFDFFFQKFHFYYDKELCDYQCFLPKENVPDECFYRDHSDFTSR